MKAPPNMRFEISQKLMITTAARNVDNTPDGAGA